ncbi:MAG: PQQ-binding-like beta-propeller repeat protein, partial [Verrucomicrobiales bacterium]|nr:PQQ-binding-like beta-propeller repeat protein [Verrucomicrobiales bacterium]
MKISPLLLLAFIGTAAASDWPSWRGPDGNGKLPNDAKYPTEWSATKNLKWKIDLPGPGNSSPIVVDGKVLLTQATDSGKTRSLLCFSAENGALLWEKAVDYGKQDTTHRTNPYCAASPVSDGKLVFAWHGNAGLHAYDLDGNEKWNRNLGTDYEHIWGPNAASPV